MKTFLKYILWIVGFFILSNFLISVGLNSMYREIERRDDNTQIGIHQAEATKVNGRIRGLIKNTQANDISNKYIKLEFYTDRDVFLGNQFIELGTIDREEMKSFELYFKKRDVAYYKASIVDEKDPQGTIEWLPKDLKKSEVILATALAFIILWP